MQPAPQRADVDGSPRNPPPDDEAGSMAQQSAVPARVAVSAAVAVVVSCALGLVLLPAALASDVSDVVQGLAALAAAVAAGRRAARCTAPRDRTTWWLVAAACTSWALGEASWCWHTLRSDEVPFPSLADVGFLGFAVLMTAGLLAHPADGGRAAVLQRVCDGLLTAGSVGLASWLTTLGAVLATDDGGGLQRLLLLAYPSTDVLLVVLTVLLLARVGRRRPALSLMGSGVVALGISDSAFAYLAARDGYDGGLVDLGWIGGFLLIALAGACDEPSPDPVAASGRPRGDELEVTVRASVLPYVPVLIALGVTAAVTVFSRPLTSAELLSACAVVLFLLARQYLAVTENVRLARELAAREQQLRGQAYSDPLTGLANRLLFRDRLEHALELHARDRRPLAVVFLDLDDFKAVNDRHGHAAGDELLVAVAGRITGASRTADTVARLGGDEFAILLEDAAAPVAAAARIAAALAPGIVQAGTPHPVRASVGVASVSADEPPIGADALLARADAAMYVAKRAGKGTVGCFDEVAGAAVLIGPPEPVAV
jgi:diguanylate cyclase (GGDEF)-like protein